MAYSNKPFIIPIFLPHAGCPHRCVFCNQSLITGVDSRHSPIKVRNSVEAFLKHKGARRGLVQIAFFGGNFLGINTDEIKRLLAEAAKFVKEGRADSIRFSTRPDTIDRYRLDIIKNFPVSTVELGVQSMDDRVLSLAKRGHTHAETEKAVHLLKEYAYEIGAQLMVGLPGDDPERMLASAQRVAKLKPDFIRIYPTVVVAGSPLAKLYNEGHYTPLSLKNAVAQVKELYRFFSRKNIRVIRMGLQAMDDLEKGSTILAGPYHPAFGHLVYSEIFLDIAISAIESVNPKGHAVNLHVHPRSVSKMRGLKNVNITRLNKKFPLQSVEIVPDHSLKEDQLALSLPTGSNYSPNIQVATLKMN
jgi:histone acetyltransferase (RNA polymerase elongator complex component)